MKKSSFWLLLVSLLALVLAACGPQGPQKGNLRITVNAPQGVTPEVQVTGPGSYSRSITTTGETNLTNLDPGNYTITPLRKKVNGYGYEGNGATVPVQAGATANHTVNYQVVTGKIEVTIAGLPSGLQAEIYIKKPDGSNLAGPLNGNTTIEDVAPGNYTVVAPDRTQNGSTYATAANNATLTVAAGQPATLNATYTLNPGTATITVGGLDASLPNPVQVTLLGSPSSPVSQSFTGNGPLTFNNLAPGTYTIQASPITNNGPQDYAYTLSTTSLTITSSASVSATLTYAKPTLSVSLAGLPSSGTVSTLTVVAQAGSGSASQTLSNQSLPFTGPVNLTLPRLANYTVTAHGASSGQPVQVEGQVVNSYWESDSPTASVSNASPSATVTLNFSDFGQTGRAFVVGNGAFTSDADAGYTLTDADLVAASPTLAAFTGSGQASAPGLFKAKFDAQGNLYLMYQSSGSLPNSRIVRISRANLKAGNWSEGAPGNLVIQSSALGNDPEPADMAFDAQGNLWVANDFESRLVCISAADLAGSGPITTPSAVYTSNVLVRPQQNNYTLTSNIHAIAFDGAGNLWFTAGDYRADVVSGSAITYGRRAVLARIEASALSCAGGTHTAPANLDGTAIPVRLDISNAVRYYDNGGTPVLVPAAGGARGILKPVALVYDAANNALWVGDYGGGNGQTGSAFRDADADQETLIRVPLDSANTTPVTARPAPDLYNLRPAQIDHRISIGYTEPPGPNSTGLQQVFGLAFDKTGALWIVANNNVLLTATDTNPGPSDRRGKLYRVQIPSRDPGLVQWAVQNVTPTQTISAPQNGIGFSGLAFNR